MSMQNAIYLTLAPFAVDIIAGIIFLIVALVLYKRGKQEMLRKMVLAFVVEAEKKLGNGTGELKYAMVVERLHATMPYVLKIMYGKKQLDTMIEQAVEFLKRYLSEGRTLAGYDNNA